MITNPELKEIQEEFLTAFKIFHKICMDNNIKYSLHGGSLLGAVREKGFIPWDDDVDISMSREEYKKFKCCVSKMVLEPETYFDDRHGKLPRLCMKRKDKPLVWISIFIYDYISEHKIFQKMKFLGIGVFAIALSTNEMIKKNHSKSFFTKCKKKTELLVWEIAQKIGRKRILVMYTYFCEKLFVGKKKYIHRANDRYLETAVKAVLPKKVMSEFIIVPFEDTQAMISKNYHEILVKSYGENYMSPIRDDSKVELHKEMRKILSN